MSSTASLDRLVGWFIEQNSGVIVALSGGVDSAVVALAASIALDERSLAITANYKTLELDSPLFRKNDELRCYYCRSELAKRLVSYGKQTGISLITDGTQVDDANDMRPGMRAITENGIKSPLVEVGLDKSRLRSIAKAYGLSVSDRPSNSCLASRLPTGVEVTADRLAKIEKAEVLVKKVFSVRQVRVRDHGEIARIEVGVDELSKLFDTNKLSTLDLKLRMLGFRYVCIDTRGYHTGNLVIID